jgi:hypothetical protein
MIPDTPNIKTILVNFVHWPLLGPRPSTVFEESRGISSFDGEHAPINLDKRALEGYQLLGHLDEGL